MTKKELFLELAKPDKTGLSRWVFATEFKGKYKSLTMGNGGDWCRQSSSLAKDYILEVDKTKTKGNSIDAIRTIGFNTTKTFKQTIRADIKNFYKNKNCVMLGLSGKSENTKIEIDHKDGRKNSERVSDIATQKIEDFQPLCKAANDAKRQICKKCKETNKRWNAKNLLGNPYPYYEGDENYDKNIGCVGCYQYDPVEYRKVSAKRIATEAIEHTVDFVMKKLYNDE